MARHRARHGVEDFGVRNTARKRSLVHRERRQLAIPSPRAARGPPIGRAPRRGRDGPGGSSRRSSQALSARGPKRRYLGRRLRRLARRHEELGVLGPAVVALRGTCPPLAERLAARRCVPCSVGAPSTNKCARRRASAACWPEPLQRAGEQESRSLASATNPRSNRRPESERQRPR